MARATSYGVLDLTMTTESEIAEGDRIAWAWVYRGSYTEACPGLTAGRGQPIELRDLSLVTFRDGMIDRLLRQCVILEQMGATATPGPATSG